MPAGILGESSRLPGLFCANVARVHSHEPSLWEGALPWGVRCVLPRNMLLTWVLRGLEGTGPHGCQGHVGPQRPPPPCSCFKALSVDAEVMHQEGPSMDKQGDWVTNRSTPQPRALSEGPGAGGPGASEASSGEGSCSQLHPPTPAAGDLLPHKPPAPTSLSQALLLGNLGKGSMAVSMCEPVSPS